MTLVGGAAALAVALVLLAAGVGHLRDPRDMRAALTAHRVLPRRLQPLVVAMLPAVELTLGAMLMLGVLAGSSAALIGDVVPIEPGTVMDGTGAAVGATVRDMGTVRLVAAGATALVAAFTVYLMVVLARTRAGEQLPCGCGLGAAPVGPWAVVRGLLLTALGLTATVGGVPLWGAQPDVPTWAEVVLVVAAGITLAIATATLPAARSLPAGLTTLHAGTAHHGDRA